MKIKIRPYPNFKLAESVLNRDQISNTVSKTDSKGIPNQLVIITEFKTGEKRIIKARPVKYQDKLYVTAFPNPVHLFLSVAIEHYNQSEEIKELNFPKCGKPFGEDIFILDVEENGTHDCYNHYVKYRASSIIMLVSAIEAYLNHIISNEFIYNAKRKDKSVKFSKTEIESSKISFIEKLTEVIPQWLCDDSFWDKYSNEKECIVELYQNRKNIIHLKTNSQDDFKRYFTVIDQMLDLDVSEAISSTITFMNAASTNFIELDN